jgi:hypothetical protein
MLMRVAVVPLTLFLVGCATVDVRGPYANRLSAEDIRQIKSFVISDPHLISPWIHITTISPNRVQVQQGGLISSDGMTIDGNHVRRFFVDRRAGKWNFDEKFGLEGTGEIISWR